LADKTHVQMMAAGDTRRMNRDDIMVVFQYVVRSGAVIATTRPSTSPFRGQDSQVGSIHTIVVIQVPALDETYHVSRTCGGDGVAQLVAVHFDGSA
jgi:hypothetical protein